MTPLNCGEGTEVNAAGDACVPRLGDDVEVDAEMGTIRPTDAALAAARQGGVDSVIPLNCALGTVANAAGDACVPNLGTDVEADEATGEIRPTDAALAAARQGGVDSVIPLNCALGTVADAAGDACVPNLGADVEANAETGEIRPTDAALAAARQGGVDSVIPLNCAEGTVANAAGDACIPNMAEDVALNVESGALVCAEDVLAAAREDGRQAGVASVDITTDNAEAIEAAMPNCVWDTEVWDGATETCVCADDAVVRDCSGVCGGDDASCEGCDGVQNSGLVVDVCGVCGGDDTSCEGCDGVPNSGLVVDACGVCDGPGLNDEGCCGDQVMACNAQCVDEIGDEDTCPRGMTFECARILDEVPCNPANPIGSDQRIFEMMTFQSSDEVDRLDRCLRNVDADFDYAGCRDFGERVSECVYIGLQLRDPAFEVCKNQFLYGVDEVTCPDGWSYESHRARSEDEEAFMAMRSVCPNQLSDAVVCTPQIQTYSCYGKTCGGFVPDANSCNGFVCETADEICAVDGSGRKLDITCESGTSCSAGL